jgi:hypothetical protein
VKLRGAALALLTLGVLAAHLALSAWVAESAAQLGSGSAAVIRRMDVAFVRELQPALPPPAGAQRPRPRPRVPRPAQRPASAPAVEEPSALASAPVPVPVPVAPEPAASAALAAADEAASAPTGSEAAAVAAVTPSNGATTTFEWPPSTRLSYTLVGDYRGPVHGQAQVEWLRSGDRYQVHLEVSVGPLLSRRMSSEGRLTENGLQPRSYEEVTEAVMRETRRLNVRFDDEWITLANGQQAAKPIDVQDTASQFVQLTWLFTTQSQRLKVGQTVEVPLALPRRVDRWLYDIHAEETLETPAGRLLTYHMKPRRSEPLKGELSIESWFAPSLQYLPVRILIRQDAQTFVDLTIARVPQQAAAEPTGR